MKQYYYTNEKSEQLGPVNEDQLIADYKEGKLPSKTHVWCEGMAGWQSIAEAMKSLGVESPTQAAPPVPPPFIKSADAPSEKNFSKQDLLNKVGQFVGHDEPVTLNWKSLFAGVFKKHPFEEAEEIFISGTKQTTPQLNEVSSQWPSPWLYSRVFVVFTITFFILKYCLTEFKCVNVIPGLLVVGPFAAPLAILILFMELNALRNISMLRTLLVFLVGGCASILVTLVLGKYFDLGHDMMGALMNSGVEEVSKLLIVYIALVRMKNCKSILNGMLIGAAVGAGFSAFESAGYALQYGFDAIYLRAFFAPGGHVVWAAIAGAALIIAKGQDDLSLSVLSKGAFWRLFLIPVGLHLLWNWEIPVDFIAEMGYLRHVILLVFVWIIALILIAMGLKEVANMVNSASSKTVEDNTSATSDESKVTQVSL